MLGGNIVEYFVNEQYSWDDVERDCDIYGYSYMQKHITSIELKIMLCAKYSDFVINYNCNTNRNYLSINTDKPLMFAYGPTEWLTELYSIRQERGSINNLIITIVNQDLPNYIHSECIDRSELISMYDNIEINYVYEDIFDNIIPVDKLKELNTDYGNGNITINIVNKLEDVLYKTDVLYITGYKYDIEKIDFTKAKPNLLVKYDCYNEVVDVIDFDYNVISINNQMFEYRTYIEMAVIEMLFDN